jgi:hypothetical protein
MFRRVQTIVGYCFCALAAIMEGFELFNLSREILPIRLLEFRHEIAIPAMLAGLVLVWLGKVEGNEKSTPHPVPLSEPSTSKNINTNTANPTQNIEQHFHLSPTEVIPIVPPAALPARPAPVVTKPRHNVTYLPPRRSPDKARVETLLTANFQNVPIPHVPVPTFSFARARVDYFNQTEELVCEVFPATWSTDEGPTVDMEPGESHPLVLAAFVEGRWKACRSTETGTYWDGVQYDIAQEDLPFGRLWAVITLIGENNISLEPIRLLIQLFEDGSAYIKEQLESETDA